MKKCFRCGTELDDSAEYCFRCGERQYAGSGRGASGRRWYEGKDRTAEFDPADIKENKAYGIIACIPVLFFIPIVACPDSRYGRFWANQGLVVLLLSFVCGIVGGIVSGLFSLFAFILSVIPVLPILISAIGGIVSFVIGLPVLAAFIIAIVNACRGRAVELPIIGRTRILK